MPSLTLSGNALDSVGADALVLAVTSGAEPGLLAGTVAIAPAARRTLLRSLQSLGATGKAGEVTKLPGGTLTSAAVVVAVGVGPAPSRGSRLDAEGLRRAAGVAARALTGTRRAAFALPAADAAEVEAIALGAALGAYAFDRFRSVQDPARAVLQAVSVLVANPRDRTLRAAVTRAKTLADAVTLARDLVNTPPSHLHPVELAEAAVGAVADLPVEVSVLDERALRRGRFGGILAVGQGSVNPPRLVRMAYRPAGATRHLALVGKGITFDSGGLSLKPPQAMETMKSDMGGAAATIAAVAAIARLGLPVSVTGWIPTAENMPSGTAQRPSDVITMYGGRTVEVLNTDAEGRLVLADALVRAQEEDPDLLVDAATLTGAQLVALGSRVSGVMAGDDSTREAVYASATRAGESMWPMPLPPELRPSLDSAVADLANIGDRLGGMLTAGLFLKEFIDEDQQWAHLDIAGPAFNEGQPYGYTPKGGTGAAVRTFVQLADDLAAGRL